MRLWFHALSQFMKRGALFVHPKSYLIINRV